MAKLRIRTERCKGCMLCVRICPRHKLKESDTLNARGVKPVCARDTEECAGCGMCVRICPDGCFEVHV